MRMMMMMIIITIIIPISIYDDYRSEGSRLNVLVGNERSIGGCKIISTQQLIVLRIYVNSLESTNSTEESSATMFGRYCKLWQLHSLPS